PSMDPPDDHGDVVLANSLPEERAGIRDDRIAHLAGVESRGFADRRAEPLLAVLLAHLVLALDDAVRVPDQHVADRELGRLRLVLRVAIVTEPVAADHQRAELALALTGAEQIREVVAGVR